MRTTNITMTATTTNPMDPNIDSTAVPLANKTGAPPTLPSTPTQDTPTQDTPTQDTPTQDTPTQDTPTQETAQNAERMLASVQRITALKRIEDTHSLSLATVLNWHIVVNTAVDPFKEGDLVVYCEIDSILPKDREVFANVRGNGRIKTAKIRGQVSQGICFPVSILPQGVDVVEGADCTDILGITKYISPEEEDAIDEGGDSKGKRFTFNQFPAWGRQTRQARCQNIGAAIAISLEKEERFEVTTKLDGTSLSIGHNNGTVVVCSRNLVVDMDNNQSMYVAAAKSLRLPERIAQFGNIMISGELCGPKISGNRERLNRSKFFVFDVFDVDNQCYLPPAKRMEIVNALGLAHVPVLHTDVTLGELGLKTVDDIIQFATGPGTNGGIREGLVFKRMDGMFSFKAISNSYLLKYQ